MVEYKIKCEIETNKICDLRQSVGWNRMENSCKKSLENSYFYICCFNGNELIGFIDVVSNGVTDAYIQDLIVKPKYQNKGIGKRLMEMAIKKLRDDGIYAISVLFSKDLLEFYKKFNFTIMLAGQLETRTEE
jgi:ribosomal protein S18 acetylase RimI-like enzyme